MLKDFPVDLCGLKLAHPIMNGAGTCKTLEDVELLAGSESAAIMVGSVTVREESGNENNTFYYESGLGSVNSVALKNPGLEYYKLNLPEMIRIAHLAGKPLFFSGAGNTPDDFAQLATAAHEAKVDLFEADFGCANKWKQNDVPELMISYDLPSFDACLKAVRVNYPERLSVKVSPYADWFQLIVAASLIKQYEVEAVTVCNAFPRAFMFRRRTKWPAVVPQFRGLGAYAGSGLHPIALGQTIQWIDALAGTKTVVIGVGGVSTIQQAREFMWLGASAVQVVTELLKSGKLDPTPIRTMLTQMEDEHRLTALVREAMGDRVGQSFRPFAVYDESLDRILVQTRDCSVVETLWSPKHPLRLLEDNYPEYNYPEEGEEIKYVGFVVECARVVYGHHLLLDDGRVDLSKLLDSLSKDFPELSESVDICRGLIAQLGQPWVDIK